MVEGKKNRSRKSWIFTLAAVILLLCGLVLVLWGPAMRLSQDIAMKQLEDRIANGEGEMKVNPRLLVVEGEDEEYPMNETETGEIEEEMPAVYTINGIALMEIPAIDLGIPVSEGASRVELRYGAGRYIQSAKIGQEGNCIIFGHRMYSYGRHFNRLDELQSGDEIILITLEGVSYTYRVTDKHVVTPSALMDYIKTPYSGKILTLVTCTPIRKATHRLLVVAELV